VEAPAQLLQPLVHTGALAIGATTGPQSGPRISEACEVSA
jgi:hypothetical protein